MPRVAQPTPFDCTAALPADRGAIARAWQRALRVPRSQLVPSAKLEPEVLRSSIETPYLGWVGENWRGGTLLLAKNPGGGGPSQQEQQAHDAAVERALIALRDGASEQGPAALDALAAAYHKQAPQIGMGKMTDRVLGPLGEQRQDIAFVNVLPYRTRGDGDASGAAMLRCMKLVVLPLLEVLRPDTVVILGANARTRSYLAWLTAPWIEVVQRPIADRNPFPASGQAALARLATDNERRRQFRARRLKV